MGSAGAVRGLRRTQPLFLAARPPGGSRGLQPRLPRRGRAPREGALERAARAERRRSRGGGRGRGRGRSLERRRGDPVAQQGRTDEGGPPPGQVPEEAALRKPTPQRIAITRRSFCAGCSSRRAALEVVPETTTLRGVKITRRSFLVAAGAPFAAGVLGCSGKEDAPVLV